MNRLNRGFTLVELLVVIAIIGILMALLLPAVNLVREQGRQTTCMNNQKALATAIINYEGLKQHLPGVMNVTANKLGYTWLPAIFPQLDHEDLWKTINSSSGSTTAYTNMVTMRLNIALCPDDPALAVPGQDLRAQLSYGVNDGFFVSYIPNSSGQKPVDRNGVMVVSTLLSKFTSRPSANFPRGQPALLAATIMLGDRTGDGTANYPRFPSTSYSAATPWAYTTARKWAIPDTPTTALPSWNDLCFHWPQPNDTPPPLTTPWPIAWQLLPATSTTPPNPGIMASAHPGKVIVTFFDGHSEKLDNDAFFPR